MAKNETVPSYFFDEALHMDNTLHEPEKITNFYNVTKSPESLVLWVCSTIYAKEYCPLKNLVEDPSIIECIKNDNHCSKCMLEWLKQPVSVKKDKEDEEMSWYYDVDHAPQGQELIVMYIDDHRDCPTSEVTVAMQDKGVWFNMLTGDFISEQICAYTYLPRPIPVNVLEENVKKYKAKNMGTEKLSNTCNDYPTCVEDEVENNEGFMTPEQFEARMRELSRIHYEVSFHVDADYMIIDLLRSLGYGAGCDIFEETPKWYS